MFRYFALIWNPDNYTQRDAAELLSRRLQKSAGVWRTALDDFGIRVFCTGARSGACEPYAMRARSGVVLGTVFTRDGLVSHAVGDSHAPVIFGEQESARIITSAGRRLIDAFWGRYVAFLYDAEAGRKFVVRDPSGGIACYSTRFRDVTIYFSAVEDCVRLQLLPFSVNWSVIGDHLSIGAVRSRETALNEVMEVYPGEWVEISRDKTSVRSHWDPQKFVKGTLIESPERAAVALRDMTQRCIYAWASCYDGLLLRLSGGLDSSIVLSCLAKAPSRPKLTCLNYYAHTVDSDERVFALEATKRAGVSLVERSWNGHVPLDAILNLPRAPRPTMSWGRIQHAKFEDELAHRTGSAAVFGGEGGDEHFYQTNVNLTAADFAFRYGMKRELLTVALNAAYCAGTSIWAVLREAWRYGVLRRRFALHSAPTDVEPLIDRSVIEEANISAYRRHPWLRSIDEVPPGKIWQIYALSASPFLRPPSDTLDFLDQVEPLEMSQPLTELCLSIPTYVLARDGYDRAIARGAFAQDLPPQITFRHAKGGPDDGIKELLRENLPFVRELLLDGMLVSRKLLNRSRLEAVLSSEPNNIFCGVGEILAHLSTEAWLRRWSEVKVRVAA